MNTTKNEQNVILVNPYDLKLIDNIVLDMLADSGISVISNKIVEKGRIIATGDSACAFIDKLERLEEEIK